MRMLNWLTTKFRSGQPLRQTNIAVEKNRANQFAASIFAIGGVIQKQRDGTAVLIINGDSQIPYPPDMRPPWPIYNPDGVPEGGETPSQDYGEQYMVYQLQADGDGKLRPVWDWVRAHA